MIFIMNSKTEDDIKRMVKMGENELPPEKNKVLRFSNNIATLYRIGIKYAESGNLNKALIFLKKSLDKNPENIEIAFKYACILSETGRINESDVFLERILKRMDSAFPECFFVLACNSLERGDVNKGISYLNKYLNTNKETKFKNQASEMLFYLHSLIDASIGSNKEYYATAQKQLNEGQELLLAGDYNKAFARFEKLMQISPMDVNPKNDFTLACFLIGRFEKAFNITKTVLRIEPDNPLAHFNMALLYAYKNDRRKYNFQIGVLERLKIKKKDEFIKMNGIYNRLGILNQPFLKGYFMDSLTDILKIEGK